jgi:cytochrome c553
MVQSGMNATRILAAAMIVLFSARASVGADAPPGASSCTGCHAVSTGVDAMPPLAGRSGIDDAMIAFKSGQRPATIMNRLAKGFTDDEIRAIAAWYAAQKP